jgi:coenzyme F420-0:L-glutamate ligase/coenzyme F420-1:gamma-L-glutamate ligase
VSRSPITLTARALPALPAITADSDLAALIAAAGVPWEDGDVVVVAQKAVSKAEGRTVTLDRVRPGARAVELGQRHGHDPRVVQVVLDESTELMRADRGVLICRTHHGLVCANAGVDGSNVHEAGTVILLPQDPDRSARDLRARLGVLTNRRLAVVIGDSFGRAWRHGQTDVAIGCAGLAPLEDWRGRRDREGRELRATWIAVADQVAGAADLVRAKDSGEPVVVVSGLERHVTADDGPGARALIRPLDEDLFR